MSLGRQKNQQATKLQGATNIVYYFACFVRQGGGGRYHKNCNLLFTKKKTVKITEKYWRRAFILEFLCQMIRALWSYQWLLEKKIKIQLLHQAYRHVAVVVNGHMIPSVKKICSEKKCLLCIIKSFFTYIDVSGKKIIYSFPLSCLCSLFLFFNILLISFLFSSPPVNMSS